MLLQVKVIDVFKVNL